MDTLGPLQLRIMQFLWTHGSATVHDVHAALNLQSPPKPLAYTTILTVLRNLARKGFLDQKPAGRSHRFTPVIDQSAFTLAMVRQLRLDLFAGDSGLMLATIAKDDGLALSLRSRLNELGAGEAGYHA